MTTYVANRATIAGLSVTGVTRNFTYASEGVYTADMPASYTQRPGGGTGQYQTTCIDDGFVLNLDLVVLVAPLGQGTDAENQAAIDVMMDNVNAALKTIYTDKLFKWTISVTVDSGGGADFWAVVASTALEE